MVILLQRLLGQKSLLYFTQFWAYLLQYCVGLILEMLWQMPSDFAIGEFVVTFVQRNPKRRKSVIWVEEAEEVVRKWWCFLQKSNAEKKKKSLAIHVLTNNSYHIFLQLVEIYFSYQHFNFELMRQHVNVKYFIEHRYGIHTADLDLFGDPYEVIKDLKTRSQIAWTPTLFRIRKGASFKMVLNNFTNFSLRFNNFAFCLQTNRFQSSLPNSVRKFFPSHEC